MMMLVCLDRGSRTLEVVKDAGRFGINVLGLDQRNAAEVFATKAPLGEKWASVEWHRHLEVPIIQGCPAHIVCGLDEVIDGGDHVILTGEVIEVEGEPGEPLVYHGGLFRKLDPEGT
jgi:flavin reductase (DIM6/NTAB) family NADH-FMN oxidoreductase RutF